MKNIDKYEAYKMLQKERNKSSVVIDIDNDGGVEPHDDGGVEPHVAPLAPVSNEIQRLILRYLSLFY